jgi:hypothetical protein
MKGASRDFFKSFQNDERGAEGEGGDGCGDGSPQRRLSSSSRPTRGNLPIGIEKNLRGRPDGGKTVFLRKSAGFAGI